MPATLRRVAMITVHTSPLERPGSGDAGGLNVYVVEVAKRLAARGTEVEIFTRATSGSEPERVDLAPGVTVRHVTAGPFEGLGKDDLPGQLCAFTAGVMRAVASRPEGHYDVVHSHYWLAGQVGWLAADRWQVPLVHTMHTMAKVKNLALAPGDRPEPSGREIGEQQVVDVADRLVANTEVEARELIDLYDADVDIVRVVPPGVDLEVFSPASPRERDAARRQLQIDPDALVILFVGRIQPLKAPDLLVEAVAALVARRPELRPRLRLVLLGGPSGSGRDRPDALADLAADLGVSDVVRAEPPVERPTLAQWYRSVDIVAVPSRSESFGLVAVEAQACGTAVLAARVGGLPTAVGGGVLLDTHEVASWSRELERLLDAPQERARLGHAGIAHAAGFSWEATADLLAEVYGEAMAHRRVVSADVVVSAGEPAGRPAVGP